MCNEQIVWADLGQLMGMTGNEIKSQTNFNPELLNQFAIDGLINYSEDKIQITSEGQLFIRNVAASLDPLYQSGQNKFSKPV
jgi:oxygen-independent coproporphyrinogen-3 oxidase